MFGEYSKPERAIAAFVFGVILSIPIWCFAVGERQMERDQAEAELATRTGLDHWWHNNDPQRAAGGVTLLAFGGTAFVFWLGYFLSPVSLAMVESINSRIKQAQFTKSVKELDADNQRQSQQMGLAQSMQEVVTRLGTIDQFIRVYQSETERSRQVVTLQAAHAEVTNLNAKLVSNEIDSESLGHPRVIACARETLADLREAGLTGDRLCRDLRRIFGMNNAA